MSEHRFGSSCCGAGYHMEPPKEQLTDGCTVWHACDTCGQPCDVIDLDAPLVYKLWAVAEAARDAKRYTDAEGLHLPALDAALAALSGETT